MKFILAMLTMYLLMANSVKGQEYASLDSGPGLIRFSTPPSENIAFADREHGDRRVTKGLIAGGAGLVLGGGLMLAGSTPSARGYGVMIAAISGAEFITYGIIYLVRNRNSSRYASSQFSIYADDRNLGLAWNF